MILVSFAKMDWVAVLLEYCLVWASSVLGSQRHLSSKSSQQLVPKRLRYSCLESRRAERELPVTHELAALVAPTTDTA